MLKIGKYTIKNRLILAPMAGVSQMPFRKMALKKGAALAPTELISAKGLFYNNIRTKSYLTYDKDIEKPFCVQLFGGEEEAMAIAAYKAAEMGAEIIDINMGCPVKKVTKTNAGSALLCDIKRAENIIAAMLKATSYEIPITVKIRSGWDSNSLNFIEVGKALENVGISAIALHARSRAQGYSGFADWNHIALLKSALTIPVIGNGDVQSIADAKKMIELTKCDGVMIGRAALGNPWVFCDSLLPITAQERFLTIKEHFLEHLELQKIVLEEPDISKAQILAVKTFRSHLVWYSKGLQNGSNFRKEIVHVIHANEVLEKIEEFFLSSSYLENSEEAMPKDDSHDGIDYRQAFG